MTSRLFVHTSTAQIGGAEKSLLLSLESDSFIFNSLELDKSKPEVSHFVKIRAGAGYGDVAGAGGEKFDPAKFLFIVPGEGPLTELLKTKKIEFHVLPWPMGLGAWTQFREKAWGEGLLSVWIKLSVHFFYLVFGLIPYLFELRKIIGSSFSSEENTLVLSSGLKSHFACLFLAPWMGKNLIFDIRDFLKPKLIRKIIAAMAKNFGNAIRVNSHRVGEDYPGSVVEYPQVKLPNEIVNRRVAGKKIISHLAFFAPYKGQDLFLQCARKLLDEQERMARLEFWIIGDVIYPAEMYARYREKIYSEAKRLNLETKVKFFGKVSNASEVQKILEQTDLLLHCTREPEPYGRVIQEALLAGCEVICHRESGACEVLDKVEGFPEWAKVWEDFLGENYIQVKGKN